MNRTDFVNYEIKNITPEEIIKSGAEIEDVQAETIICLQRFRTKIKCPVCILTNGLTSGDHLSKEHKDGKAVDIFVNKFSNVFYVIYLAIESGFRGIGVYYNHESKTYTFHFDLGVIRTWGAYKMRTNNKWTYYHKILKDPKEIV